MSTHIPSLFRPTRRDLIIVLLALSTSYLFLSPRPETSTLGNTEPLYLHPTPIGDNSGTSASGKLKLIPDWLWHTPPASPNPAPEPARESTFGESVQTYGTSQSGYVIGGSAGAGAGELNRIQGMPDQIWDQGNEDRPLSGDSAPEINGLTTELLGHQPGWTLMDRVYLFAGSLYVVTEKSQEWPDLVHMTSTGKPANNDPGNAEERYPTGKEIIFISPREAAELWGPRVMKMAGTTWLFNDGQFIDHYYHFSAELLLGAWRAYATLDQNITPEGETTLPPPRRAWFMHQNATEWRDKPRFNPTVLFSAFPSIALLYPQDWEDFALVTNSTHPRAYMLERALLADRSAAFYGDYTAPTSRTVASAIWVGQTSPWWWEPIRRQILRVATVPDSVINRNLEGWGAIDPVHFMSGVTPGHAHPIGRKPLEGDMDVDRTAGLKPVGDYSPVVTYISRQSSRRRLNKESHEGLVRALEAGRDKLGYELHVVEAEKLSREEQFALAGKTTIMLGVHGNGLTHLLWMPATPRSAVIEMYFRGGFARDYQWTAHCLGMRHFGVQHDVSYTAPALPEVEYPEGFHGTEITVDGPFVAGLIEDRLSGRI